MESPDIPLNFVKENNKMNLLTLFGLKDKEDILENKTSSILNIFSRTITSLESVNKQADDKHNANSRKSLEIASKNQRLRAVQQQNKKVIDNLNKILE